MVVASAPHILHRETSQIWRLHSRPRELSSCSVHMATDGIRGKWQIEKEKEEDIAQTEEFVCDSQDLPKAATTNTGHPLRARCFGAAATATSEFTRSALYIRKRAWRDTADVTPERPRVLRLWTNCKRACASARQLNAFVCGRNSYRPSSGDSRKAPQSQKLLRSIQMQ